MKSGKVKIDIISTFSFSFSLSFFHSFFTGLSSPTDLTRTRAATPVVLSDFILKTSVKNLALVRYTSRKSSNPILNLLSPMSTPNLRLRIQSFEMAGPMRAQVASYMQPLPPLIAKLIARIISLLLIGWRIILHPSSDTRVQAMQRQHVLLTRGRGRDVRRLLLRILQVGRRLGGRPFAYYRRARSRLRLVAI